ncbi:hypothetical protein HN451_08900 [archaeon]|nr:hypothetical protein [archaeon]
MTNIQSSVTNFIDQDVSIRRGLSRGFINSRALAKYIQHNLGLSCSVDAVISAIRRHEIKEENKINIKKRYKIIADAKISSRSDMVSVLLKKNMDVRKSIIKLYNKIDFTRGEVLRILEVNQFMKIIIDRTNMKYVHELFPKNDIISTEQKLGEISLIYDEEVEKIPGVFAALTSELGLSSISIRDGVICGSEHIFIIKKDDLMKALETFYKISKWGEKN